MSPQEEYMALIEAYLSGALKGEALSEFETKVKEDNSLAKEVEFQRGLYRAMAEEDVFQLEDVLLEVRKEYHATPEKKQTKIVSLVKRYRLFVAATIALILIATIWISNNLTFSEKDLFAQHYEPFPIYLIDRSSSDELKTQAVLYYNQGDYIQSLSLLEKIPEDDPDYFLSLFYQGICHLSTDNHELAQQIFRKLLNQGDNQMLEQSEWYLALSLLNTKNTNEAIELLNSISEKNGVFASKARLIAKEIE